MEDSVNLESVVPKEVIKIMDALESAGYQAFLVGGSVRDILLCRNPKDYDIATDATPQEVGDLFPRVVPTGVKYGTVTVHGQMDVEVTTFRRDGRYLDGRRPEAVTFSHSLRDDVLRRDFTVNALALSSAGQVKDCVFGRRDLLDLRVIRCVGDPDHRFGEDALRMMRAHRFVAQLKSPTTPFVIEPDTLNAIKRNAHLIVNVSWERIRDELTKILLSDNPATIGDLYHTGLLAYVLPELAACKGLRQVSHDRGQDVFEHTLAVVEATPKRLWVRLAALLHDLGKRDTLTVGQHGRHHFCGHHEAGARMTREILMRLRFDSRTVDAVSTLVREHMSRFPFLREPSVKRFVNRVGIENLEDLFHVQSADIQGSEPPHDFSKLDALKEEVRKVLNSGEPLTLKDLAISGRDLMDWGMTQGKEVGSVLDYMLKQVLERPGLNTRDNLKSLFDEIRKECP